MTNVAMLTYFKCDMCGRTWKEGRNDQAIAFDVTIAAHDKARMKGQKKAQALLCGPRCAEMALAAVVYGLKVREKTDEDRKKEQAPTMVFGQSPFGGLLGFRVEEQRDDTDQDDADDE